MQELEFGLTIKKVRKLRFNLPKSVGREYLFNMENNVASKWWWSKFKERKKGTTQHYECLKI